MPLPQISGTVTMRQSSTAAVLDISSVPLGGWMIVSVMSSTTNNMVTSPGSWSVLRSATTTGTRRNFVFGKIKDVDDESTVTFSQSVAVMTSYGLVYGTGSDGVANWIVGESGYRHESGEPAGARYSVTAPSVTTTTEDTLVLTIANEATLAQSQSYEVASFTSGWTERLWFAQVAPNDRIETIWAGSKDMPSPGSTGNNQVTYIHPQDNNAIALQIALPPTAPVSNVPSVVGAPSVMATSSSVTSFTVDRPSGVVNGDYIVVVVRGQSSSATAEPTNPLFTRIGPAFVPSNSTYRMNGVYGRPITDVDSEPLQYTFTNTGGGGRVVIAAFTVRNVDLDNPVAGFFDSYGGNIVSGGRAVEAYSLQTTPALSILWGGSEFVANEDHAPTVVPAGYTSIVDAATSNGNLAVSRTYLYVGVREVDTSTVPASQITWASTASGPAVGGIAFNGISGEPVDPAGDGFTSLDGRGQEVKVFYTGTEGVRTPSSLVPIRRGFDSVAHMLATPGFTWAHRGGSTSWPEMSLYAYTRSVARGYGVLEVSLGRTSDGVWFGLHDQTTDRTSGGTYGNASAQTWAQVQAQQIVVGAQGAPQPYMRWEEIVAAYGSTHILVVDPKYALGSHRTEFLNMVYNDIGTDRAIIKYSGSGSGAAALADAAGLMGFETWGFFYEPDRSVAAGGNGNIATWGPRWSLIGLDYTASQDTWDEAIGLGKPVIAHIIPNQAAYVTAMSKGAVGAQVSGVGVVAPVSWWT